MKRGRNQRRRQGGSNPNRALDSNGPDVRIRGTANQIYDKYTALARDASSAGDRVKAESYLQHAEHYFRLIRAQQPPQQQQQQSVDADGDQPNVGDGDNKSGERQQNERSSGRNNRRRDEAKDAEKSSSDASNEDNDASSSDESADVAPEEKPKRRRTRKSTKAADDAKKDEPETAAAAAE